MQVKDFVSAGVVSRENNNFVLTDAWQVQDKGPLLALLLQLDLNPLLTPHKGEETDRQISRESLRANFQGDSGSACVLQTAAINLVSSRGAAENDVEIMPGLSALCSA